MSSETPIDLRLATVVLVAASYAVWYIVSILSGPVWKYPGPVLAKFTRLWFVRHVTTGDSHHELQALHDKHGPIVCIAPDIINIDIPEMIPTVLSTKGEWRKTEFYDGNRTILNGNIITNMFNEKDPAMHSKERKPIAKFYSPVATSGIEPHMDKVINLLCEQLDSRFLSEDRSFDLGRWILYYTWDVVGAITFSQPMGYLQKGYDFDKTLLSSEKALDYFSFVGAMPILDHLLDKNPIFRMGPPGFNTITATAIQRVQDRVQGKDGHIYDPKTPDYLDRFLEIKKVNPNDVDDFQIISWLMVNLIAGADTTAITIRSAIYYPLKDPRVWKKLVKEVRESTITSTIPPEYKDAKALPYVEAVVREALRFLPGVALPIQRYVPKAGFTLPNGDYLPPGTIVGMNPYVSNRNKEVFGHDSHDFRPERWLRDDANETEDEYQLRLSRMNKCDISFGGGSRICLGQHIGLFQTYKVLVTLVAKYDIELATDKEWKVINSWFPRQEGLEVKISPAPGS